MGHFLFLFVLLAASTILPSGLANSESHFLVNEPAYSPPSDELTLSLPPADIQAFLRAHNNFRAKHHASPLAWDGLLASKAQQWASNCQFKHSGGKLGRFGGSYLKFSGLIILDLFNYRELGCGDW